MSSIQARLTAQLVGGLFILFALCGVGLYAYIHFTVIRNLNVALLLNTESFIALTHYDDDRIEFELAEGERNRLQKLGFYRVWLDDGTILGESDWMKDFDLSEAGLNATSTDLSTHEGRSFSMTLPNGEHGQIIMRRYFPSLDVEIDDDDDESDVLGHVDPRPLNLFMGESRAHIDTFLRRVALGFIAVGFVLVSAVAIVVPRLVRKGLEPVRAIGDTAALLDETKLNHRFSSEELPNELAPIAESLNGLLACVDSAFTREKRFTADAAHELRTPIAELRTLVEVELRGLSSDAVQERSYLNDVLGIATHMERLVEALLSIARGEASELSHGHTTFQVANIVDTVWQGYEEQAKAHCLSFDTSISDDVTLDGDAALFRAILSNALNNAVSYTPEGGAIRVSASNDGGFTLTIENSNDQLSADDIPHLFEPFWRKDVARSASSHTGLGLSIVAAFAERLGMDVSASLTSTSDFQLRLCPVVANSSQV